MLSETRQTLSSLPEGYADLTVAQISAAAKDWDGPALEAALAYEQEHAKRKGALAAREAAIGSDGDQDEDTEKEEG